jgi:hypothetical protein
MPTPVEMGTPEGLISVRVPRLPHVLGEGDAAARMNVVVPVALPLYATTVVLLAVAVGHWLGS